MATREQYRAAAQRALDRGETDNYNRLMAVIKQYEPPEPLGIGERFAVGRGETLAEQRELLEQASPGTTLHPTEGGLMFQRPGSPAMSPVNPPTSLLQAKPDLPGLLGDVAQFAGEYGPEMVGGTLAAIPTGGMGLLATMGAVGAGALGGKAIEEGVESLQGAQRQAPQEQELQYLGVLGENMAGEMGGHYLPQAWNMGVRSAKNFTGKLAEDINLIRGLASAEPDILMGPLTGLTESPIARRLESQIESLVGSLSGRVDAINAQAASLGQRWSPSRTEIERHGQRLRQLSQGRQQGAVDELLKNRRVTPLYGAQALKRGYETVAQATKGDMRQAYAAVDDFLADAPPLLWGLRRSKSLAGALQQPGEKTVFREVPGSEVAGAGSPNITPERRVEIMTDYIESAAPGPAKLRRVEQVIKELDPQQTDWKTLKALRSQAGTVLEDWPWQEGGKAGLGKAKQLYGALSEDMAAPEGPGQVAAQFKTLAEEANTRARTYYDMLEAGSFQRVFKNEGTAALINNLVRNPDQYFSDSMGLVLRNMPRADRLKVQKSIQDRVLMDEDPTGILQRIRRDNPEAMDRLFETPADQQIFEHNVAQLKELTAGPSGRFLGEADKSMETLQSIITDELKTPARVKDFIDTFGERGREALREGALERVLDIATVADPKTGNLRINPVSLRNSIKDMERSGLWGVLSDIDRTRIRQLEAYVRRFGSRLRDMGTSLHAAGEIAKLRTPKWPSAVATIGTSRLLSRVILNEGLTNRVMSMQSRQPVNLARATRFMDIVAPFTTAYIRNMVSEDKMPPSSEALQSWQQNE